MDEKPKRTLIRKLSMTDKLKSDVKGLEYPVDALKDIYVRTEKTAERIAKDFGISLKQFMEYVEAGDWERLKREHEQRKFNTILNLRGESFVDNLTTDQREQIFTNFQRNQELDDLEEHFKKWGHLFCVNPETGEILRDRYSGMPIKIKFGSSKDAVLTRRELQANIELNMKLLIQDQMEKPKLVKEEPKQLEEGKDVIDAYLEGDDD